MSGDGVDPGLAALAALAGDWRGESRVLAPRGELCLVHTEHVEALLAGHVVTMHGASSFAPGASGAAAERPAFEALAVITADPEAGPLIVAHRGPHRLEAPIELAPSRFVWVAPGPDGDVRYEARYDDGTWEETGTVIRTGATVLRMRLSRVADRADDGS